MEKKTKVINMFGGSGCGKSTAAAGLFHQMKLNGENVELVREYVKAWAWAGKKIDMYDQIYIFGKQARSEYSLYGKVDYIVTDSPILLSPIYDKFYNGKDAIIEESALKFIKKAQNNGIEHINFLLDRQKAFNPEGRYETEEQAIAVDAYVKEFLNENFIPYHILSCPDEERIKNILNIVNGR
jgi:nicotinamide riboside kinase